MAPSSDRQQPLLPALEPRSVDCGVHGPYTSTGVRVGQREIWKPCPSCASEQAEEDRLQRERALVQEMQVRAGIPARYLDRGFDAFVAEAPQQKAALAAARAYAEGFAQQLRTGRSLMLLGTVGTGKTHVACAILQALMPMHCGRYLTVSDLIDTIRETWRRDSERSHAKVLHELATTPLLVLDEMGAQYGSDGEQTTLFQVIDRRYRERRPMVVVANLNPANLKTVIGERSYDRLREIATVIPFEWESHRAPARKGAAA